jgi:hypothetical protein
MTQTQENVTSMMETTLQYLDDNNKVWSGKAALVTSVSDAKDAITAIRGAAGKQEAPLSGISDEKSQARAALEDLALDIADPVSAYADRSENVSLSADVNVSRSSLDQAQDDNLVQIAERIRDAANTNVGELGDYGVSASDVKALTKAITTFSGMKTAPRTAKATKSGATQSVSSLVRSARSLFRNQIDKLMTPYRRTNAEFYAGYLAARVIVDRNATQAGSKRTTSGPGPAPSPAPPQRPA